MHSEVHSEMRWAGVLGEVGSGGLRGAFGDEI